MYVTNGHKAVCGRFIRDGLILEHYQYKYVFMYWLMSQRFYIKCMSFNTRLSYQSAIDGKHISIYIYIYSL